MVSGGCFILEAVDSNWKVDVPMWGISIQSYTRRGDIQPFPGLWSWSVHWNGSRAYSYCGIDIGWQRFLVVADSSWAPPITSKNLAPADRALWRLGSTLLDKHDWIFIYLHPILCDYCWVEKRWCPNCRAATLKKNDDFMQQFPFFGSGLCFNPPIHCSAN